MAFHYAQIDETGLVVGESWLSGMVSRDTMIPLSDDFSPLGKRYHRDTGEWENIPQPEPEYEPTSDELLAEVLLNQVDATVAQQTQDEAQAEMLLNQINILSNQESQDETLAEILLNNL